MALRLIKDTENIKEEDKAEALRIINRLKVGDRVFGNPAEGLKQTMKKLEENHLQNVSNQSVLDYMDADPGYKQQYNMLKAGINGEEELAEYFEKIIKYDKTLQDVILFASLSDLDQNSGGDDYISDSDFIAVYGRHIIILDAKNIVTSPDFPIYLDGNILVGVGGKEILELHPSTHIWRNIFIKNDIMYNSMDGAVVIVNKTGATVWKNKEWFTSDVKPIHISNLVDFLHDWIKDKDSETPLSLLVTLSKMQIKKEKSSTVLEIRSKMEQMGI